MDRTVAGATAPIAQAPRRALAAWTRFVARARTLLVDAFRGYQRHRDLELGAALAYYTIFSLAPVLVVVIAVAGLAFGREAARGEIFAQFRGLVGVEGARTLELAVESASKPASGIVASAVGLVLLLIGAAGVFVQLQSSLDRIWEVTPARGGIRGMLRQQLVSFAMVLGTGFLLLVSLVASAGLAAFGRWFGSLWPALSLLLQLTNLLVSLVVIAAMFACIFKMLPNARVAWKDVWIGGAIASMLFAIGKFLIGLYVSLTHVGMAYGVAGSVLVILVWIYYSSQIVFFGAECTRVYANRWGSCIRGSAAPPERCEVPAR